MLTFKKELKSHLIFSYILLFLTVWYGMTEVRAQARLIESFGDASNSTVRFIEAPHKSVTDCNTLRRLTDSGVTVISASRRPARSDGVPAHCAIHGVITPEVQFWLWLPDAWNGRFYMQGHGEYAGTPPSAPSYAAKIDNALRHNFAVAFTNTGHDAAYEPVGSFAYNDLQKTMDYAYRSVHLTAVSSKAIVAEYYGRTEEYSYWDGCSTGGRLGLMEAQRFPDDFDGILAGAPVNDQTNLHIWMAWVYQKLDQTPIRPDKVVNILAPAVYSMCDGLDGLKDGLIQDPRMCRFTPSEHLPMCPNGTDGDDCFTSAEIGVLEHIYRPVISRGKAYFPGLQLGTEPEGVINLDPNNPVKSGWNVYLIDENGGPGRMEHLADTFFRYFAFKKDDPEYDWRNLDFDKDIYEMDHIREMLDAVQTDMSDFKAQGGKIISYHGWSDVGPPASFTAKYYDDVVADMGLKETQEFYRLFMVPGMFHCGGGFGTDFFDAMTPLIEWVEKDIVPKSITASQHESGKLNGDVLRTRPLCPYPQIAKYKGSGNVDDAANFTCAATRSPGNWWGR